MLRSFASSAGTFTRRLRPQPLRMLVSRGGVAIGDRKADPRFIDAAVNTVAGEVKYDQLEPHELTRLRADREKQLDIRNFTLNFGPQHPVCPVPASSGLLPERGNCGFLTILFVHSIGDVRARIHIYALPMTG